jgi:hypothetical protein
VAAPENAPCDPWLDWTKVEDVCADHAASIAETWMQDAILAAITRELWTKTCRQFGVCSAVVRPVPCCVHYRRFCTCARYLYLELSREPVASVSEVLIDGDVLAASAYRVDDYNRLVRVDGDIWPRCNDLELATTEDRTFSVAFTFGAEVPAEGVLAAALLACKWAESIGLGDCEVPVNATSVDREGVHIEIRPPTLSTGNLLVDEWLQSFDCGRGGIFDPGARRRFVRAGT